MKKEQAEKTIEWMCVCVCVCVWNTHTPKSVPYNWKYCDDHYHDDDNNGNCQIINHPTHPSAYQMMKT